MKTIEPQFTLKDNVWIYADTDTGHSVVDLKGNEARYRHLPVSIPIGSEAPGSSRFVPGAVLKMVSEAWSLAMQGVNPRLLHNQLMKVREYQTQVCPQGFEHQLTASAPKATPRKLHTLDELPQAPKGHFEKKEEYTGSDRWIE